MSVEFWVGLAVIPIVVLVFLLLKSAYALATRAWWKLHVRMITKVKLKQNPVIIQFKGDPPPPERPKYEQSANRVRDALLESPSFYMFYGLGGYIIVGRDSRSQDRGGQS